MSNNSAPTTNPSQPVVYQIRIKGHLGREWAAWFEGLTITLEEDGNTLLTGPVVDQAALHGLLKKVRDLGMPLVSVNPSESGPSTTLPNWRHIIMKLKTALFISLKIITLTFILFIFWSVAGGVIGL